jgi:hypothetical protein
MSGLRCRFCRIIACLSSTLQYPLFLCTPEHRQTGGLQTKTERKNSAGRLEFLEVKSPLQGQIKSYVWLSTFYSCYSGSPSSKQVLTVRAWLSGCFGPQGASHAVLVMTQSTFLWALVVTESRCTTGSKMLLIRIALVQACGLSADSMSWILFPSRYLNHPSSTLGNH